jgi:hypothetical protein
LATKDELLVLMADAIYETPPSAATDERESWRVGLHRWAWEQHEILRKHTWALSIPINGPPISPNQIIWLERGLQCLTRTGLSESEKLSVIMLLSGFTRNEATVSAEIQAAFSTQASAESVVDERAMMDSYRQLMQALAVPERFPAFNAAISAGVLDKPSGPDDEFIFGLERVLDGIGALVDQRTTEA